jgi:TolB protein
MKENPLAGAMTQKTFGSNELKMIGNSSYHRYSPDNKQLAFVKYEINKTRTSELGTIWIMSVDGENQVQITGSDLGNASYPNWSPNGKSLVFQLTKNNKKDSDIYTTSVDGENLKQHTSNKSDDFAHYWTNDNFIYFSSDRVGKNGEYCL